MGLALRKALLVVVIFLASATSATSYSDPLLCIKHYESDGDGGWRANTGNGYYGGLQMDLSFQHAYGWIYLSRWGTADRWPAWAQLSAGHRAVASRGYAPWPQTRRYCHV